MNNVRELNSWNSKKDFMDKVYFQLETKMSEDEIENLTIKHFQPYLNIEQKQLDFTTQENEVCGFILCIDKSEKITILDYKDEQFNFSDFNRVNEIKTSYEQNANKIDKTQLFLARQSLEEILSYDPIYKQRKKEEQKQYQDRQKSFRHWLSEANEIIKFELIHNQYHSNFSSYLSLHEKDGLYKLREIGSDSNPYECDKEELNRLLEGDYSVETIENLNFVYNLINEKKVLESKIQSFRKSNTHNDEPSKESKIIKI